MFQTIAFSGARQINAKAEFFRYESCNASGADESIRVRADGNDLGLFLPGDYVDLPKVCTQWEITPVTATATGFVRLGVGSVGSSRLTGSVTVIDGNRNDVLAGKAYTVTSSFGGTAATYAAVGIWNPAGSGRIAVLTDLDLSTAAATSLTLGMLSIAPSNLDTGSNNKLIGSGNSAIQRAYQEYATPTPASFSRNFVWVGVTAVKKAFSRPLLVNPGFGLVVINSTAAQQIVVNLEFTEEAK